MASTLARRLHSAPLRCAGRAVVGKGRAGGRGGVIWRGIAHTNTHQGIYYKAGAGGGFNCLACRRSFELLFIHANFNFSVNFHTFNIVKNDASRGGGERLRETKYPKGNPNSWRFSRCKFSKAILQICIIIQPWRGHDGAAGKGDENGRADDRPISFFAEAGWHEDALAKMAAGMRGAAFSISDDQRARPPSHNGWLSE